MKEGQEFTFPVSINVTSWSLGTLSLRAALVYPEQRGRLHVVLFV